MGYKPEGWLLPIQTSPKPNSSPELLLVLSEVSKVSSETLQPWIWAVLYLWAGTWDQAVPWYTGVYYCLVSWSNPQLHAQFILTPSTTDASVPSQELPVFFSQQHWQISGLQYLCILMAEWSLHSHIFNPDPSSFLPHSYRVEFVDLRCWYQGSCPNCH